MNLVLRQMLKEYFGDEELQEIKESIERDMRHNDVCQFYEELPDRCRDSYTEEAERLKLLLEKWVELIKDIK